MPRIETPADYTMVILLAFMAVVWIVMFCKFGNEMRAAGKRLKEREERAKREAQ